MKRTKVICTIGPATRSEDMIKKLIKAGMNCARLNLSHGDWEEHTANFKVLDKLRTDLGVPLAIMLDTKGPEIRIKKFENGSVELIKNNIFTLTTREVEGNKDVVTVTNKNFTKLVEPKHKILLNDGLIELVVLSVEKRDVVCKVVVGGMLSNNKSINLPNIDLHWNYLKDSCLEDLDLAVKLKPDYLALSFISYAEDVVAVRKYLAQKGIQEIKLISKIENAIGVKNIESILKESDGVMIARGDLGVEVEYSKIPSIQKEIIFKANEAGKIVVTATQMLESMIENIRPTRAEISDVANAVFDGTSAVMLSGETAMGKYPIETIEAMIDIIEDAEKNCNFKQRFLLRNDKPEDFAEAVAYATTNVSFNTNCKAIIVATWSGISVIKVSAYLPQNLIIACTPSVTTFNQLAIAFGAIPVLTKEVKSVEKLFELGKESALKNNLVQKGDVIVQTAGETSQIGGTNQFKIDVI